MIRHVVIFTLLDTIPSPTDAARQIGERLLALEGRIPGLESIEIGYDIGRVDWHAPVVLISEHTSAEALEAYQIHPEHIEVGAFISTLVAARHVVDYEL